MNVASSPVRVTFIAHCGTSDAAMMLSMSDWSSRAIEKRVTNAFAASDGTPPAPTGVKKC